MRYCVWLSAYPDLGKCKKSIEIVYGSKHRNLKTKKTHFVRDSSWVLGNNRVLAAIALIGLSPFWLYAVSLYPASFFHSRLFSSLISLSSVNRISFSCSGKMVAGWEQDYEDRNFTLAFQNEGKISFSIIWLKIWRSSWTDGIMAWLDDQTEFVLLKSLVFNFHF